jgi:hypothetical protein
MLLDAVERYLRERYPATADIPELCHPVSHDATTTSQAPYEWNLLA